jgi:glucose/arabinose dehydrogenase
MDFGPDGCLYVAQGSNSAMGAADSTWGYRPERRLSASVLRVDLAAIQSPPLDVKTEEGGAYDPFAPGAPVTLYATGVRNAYDLVWHRNGHLYAPLNGSSSGGNTPGTPADVSAVPRRIDQDTAGPYGGPPVPPLSDVSLTAVDVIERIVKGSYYGHPNPTLGEYVLNGGNPTAGPDPDEVPEYPVGTAPDRNWRPPAWRFGQHWAPCGIIEFKGNAFGGALDGKLLVARYSGGKDLAVLTPGGDGDVAEALIGIEGLTGFGDPLDLTQHPATGFLYVSEFAERRITLLRPKEGVESTRVFRQTR